MQIPIALAELIPGILLIIGVFSRLGSAVAFNSYARGNISYVKGAQSLTGDGGSRIGS